MRTASKHPGKAGPRKVEAPQEPYKELLSGVVSPDRTSAASRGSIRQCCADIHVLVGGAEDRRARTIRLGARRLRTSIVKASGPGPHFPTWPRILRTQHRADASVLHRLAESADSICGCRAVVNFADVVCEICRVAPIPVTLVSLRPAAVGRGRKGARILRA